MKYSESLIKEAIKLHQSGFGIGPICRQLNISSTSVLRKWFSKAFYDYAATNRATPSMDSNLKKSILSDYKSGLGIYALAAKYFRSYRSIYLQVSKAGLLDSSRQFKRVSGSHRANRHPFNFTSGVKHQAFIRSKGLCEYCHKDLGTQGNWRSSLISYHHIKPIYKALLSEAQTIRSIENCMVLHRSCHEDPVIFKELHGIRKPALYQASNENSNPILNLSPLSLICYSLTSLV